MELLDRFAAGDLEAFEELFRQFQKAIYGWILRIVRNPAAAEDLTMETFLRMYRARARFDPQGNFGAWVRRIATNLALDHLRRARREVELPSTMPAAPEADPVLPHQLREQVSRAFAQLPAKLRVAATLALIEDRPYEEIAEALGISPGAVKSRVFRAVRKLRARLERLGIRP